MSALTDALQRVLDRSARGHDVPGAVAAVLTETGVEAAATGVLNLETGVRVTPDSVFQIGSITKVYTATLIMLLAARSRLDLDAPVREALPEFRVADPEVSARVTPRHLLSHTSGIAGDALVDGGRGDDCLARYVSSIADLGQDVPLGTVMSYSNTGYAILGRIVEVLTGRTFDEVLGELLCKPLGLQATVTLPEQVLRFRAAWGHLGGGTAGPVRAAPYWSTAMRSMGPAGGSARAPRTCSASSACTSTPARSGTEAGWRAPRPSGRCASRRSRSPIPGPAARTGALAGSSTSGTAWRASATTAAPAPRPHGSGSCPTATPRSCSSRTAEMWRRSGRS